jgi:acetyl-CoA carboxylase beta subunit/acetyl-CoA carboxylase alpha subunit
MSRSEQPSSNPHEDYPQGEAPPIEPLFKQEPVSFMKSILEVRPKVNPKASLADINVKANFEEFDKYSRIKHDVVGLKRRLLGGKIETYSEKLNKEEQKGHQESASYGLGKIGEQSIVMYEMHWDFFAGSLGEVAGEKFEKAADLAIKKNLPLVAIYSSAGVRQQENFAGLLQMERMENAIENFKEKRKQPYVAILSGEVWGGISASAVPQADVIIALAGTNFGFSGPRVIETQEGEPVPEGAQSAEAHLINRNLDVIVQDRDELLKYLKQLFKTVKTDGKKLSEENKPELKVVGQSQPRGFHFEKKNRIISPLNVPSEGQSTATASPKEKQIFPNRIISRRDELYARYEDSMKSSREPDAEFFIDTMCTDVTKFYNAYEEKTEDGNILQYPARIGAIGKIGSQRILFIGDMPSHYLSYDGVKKKPALPEPKDFEFQLRMLRMGARLGLPLVNFCDTPGAKPTLESERIGQSRYISDVIKANRSYPEASISYDLDSLGSGGGLTTFPAGERRVMLAGSMAYVAEPRSATSILYNKAGPTMDEIKDTLASMKATAKDQMQLGLIDAIIPNSENPYITAKRIHDDIVETLIRVGPYSARKLKAERNKRIRDPKKGFEIRT